MVLPIISGKALEIGMGVRLFFFCCLLCTGVAHADSPLLSSKAVGISIKAKEAIEGHDEKPVLAAVESLQQLLRESSFRRLEPQSQVQILFLLSKGLQRLEKYKEQEQLLLSYAKKEGLYRFQVPLKTALARSFIHQHRLEEAEGLLSKLIKSSCAHLPLEEKGEIAKVVVFKDEYIEYLLRQADKLCELGRFEEALMLYRPILSALDRQQFPYQSSPVEKRRLRQKLLLCMAEAYFCLGKFSETLFALTEWDDELFIDPSDQPLITRRLFLIASAHQKQGEREQATLGFQQYFVSPYLKSPFLDAHLWSSPLHSKDVIRNDPLLPPPLLIWDAQEALQAYSAEVLAQSIAVLQGKVKSGEAIPHLLKGFHAALEHNIPLAIEELKIGLSKPVTPLDAPWRKASLHLLAECGFEKIVLLTCSHQVQTAAEFATQLLPFFTAATHPDTLLQVSAIHLCLYKTTNEISHLHSFETLLETVQKSQLPYSHSLFSLLKSIKDGSTLLPSDNYSLSERCFASHLGITIPEQGGIETPSDEGIVTPPSPFSKYLEAISLYRQVCAEESSVDQVVSLLRDCLSTVGLEDVRPHLLNCLLDLSLRSGALAQAEENINEMIKDYPQYAGLPQAVLSCIFAFESVPTFEDKAVSLCHTLFERHSADIYALILSVHLFETHLLHSVHADVPVGGGESLTETMMRCDPWRVSFEHALQAKAEARTLAAEAGKSQEPSVIKDRVQAASKSFDVCRTHALEAIESFQDSQSKSALWGLILGVESEKIEMLEQYITKDSAFNELPDLLEASGTTLREDLTRFSSSIPQNESRVSKAFVEACSSLPETATIFALTFRRTLDSAIAIAHNLPDSCRPSRYSCRALLFLAKNLRETKKPKEALDLLSPLHEREMKESYELSLEIAMEKSLCLRELQQPDKAKALLAWVINGPYASSLRVKAMLLRADLYLSLNRKDLAIRQLKSVAVKGGEWGAAADRKLRELYGTD